MKRKLRIYLANGLFNEADRLFNKVIYKELKKLNCEVYAPQFNLAINDKKKSAGSKPIYEGDTAKVKWADVLLAVIDDEDLGTATEVGWVAGYNSTQPKSKQKVILGLYTDVREPSKTWSQEKNIDMKNDLAECQYSYINLYFTGAIKKYGKLFDNLKDLLKYLKTLIKKRG